MLFAGCGISTKFASRKYTKGYFVDNPGTVKCGETERRAIATQVVISQQSVVSKQPIALTQNEETVNNTNKEHGDVQPGASLKNSSKPSPKNTIAATQSLAGNAIAEDGDGNGGRHATKDESSTASYNKKASWFFGGVCLIGLILYGVFVLMQLAYNITLIYVGFPLLIVGALLMLVFDLFAVSYALEAISRSEPNPVGAYVVLTINILALLFAAIAVGSK